MNYTKIDEIRFWSHVAVSKQNNGCWYWKGSHHVYGYGWFRINKKTYLCHRLSLIFYSGKEEVSKQALHSCDNPICCNPLHLRWGSANDNVQDAIKRHRKTDPPIFHGEKHPRSKLKWKDVDLIRERLTKGELISVIHADYSWVSVNTLYRIRGYQTWKVREQ